MEQTIAKLVTEEAAASPIIGNLIMAIIMFLGIGQLAGIIKKFTGRNDKVKVEEEKGQWKSVINELVLEVDSLKKILKDHDREERESWDRVKWLYDAHHQFDDDGVPKWFVRKSLEITIKELSGSIEKQTRFFEGVYREQKEIRRDLDSIKDKINERN